MSCDNSLELAPMGNTTAVFPGHHFIESDSAFHGRALGRPRQITGA
jgi:hypothetical protein